MEVVKKYWLAGNIDQTLNEIREILDSKDDTIPEPDTLLLFACIFYQLGHLKRAVVLLNRVKCEVSDVKQWTVENNTLVLKYLESKSLEDKKAVALSFGLLHEKIAGIPFKDVCLLELNVCLNYALVMFCSSTQHALVPGGYNISQAVLLKTLDRVIEATPNYEPGQKVYHFTEDRLRFYFKDGQGQKQEELNLVATLVWLLACNFLVNYQVPEAQRLMEIILDFYKPNVERTKDVDLIFSLMTDAGKIQDLLMPVCHLLFSYCLCILKKTTLSMNHCDHCLSVKPHFIGGIFMKALLLYESGKYEEAIQCLQEIATSNDIGYKATALNVLGCICAKLNKPQTALLKFRESFSCHSGLESLYNVAVVYHDMGESQLELSLWKYILKILYLKNWHVSDSAGKAINVDYICGITAQALHGSIFDDHFLISTDIHCVQRCDLRTRKLSLPSVLFKIAHNSFVLKRYSEASEFYGQLIVQLNDKPVNVRECGISSLSTVYKEFAEVLLKCARYEECLVVCEKILRKEKASNSSGTLSLQDSNMFQEGKTLIDIMLCKALALKELQRPIEANECYESILDAINSSYDESFTVETHSDEPKRKIPKQESGPNKKQPFISHEEFVEVQKLKALTLKSQSSLLFSLGRKNEARLLLAQSKVAEEMLSSTEQVK